MIASVTGRRAFLALRSDGTRLRSNRIRLTRLCTGGDARLSFAIGRSFGPAVDRNRARRRLRHAFRDAVDLDGSPVRVHGDYLVTCSRSVLDAPYPELVAELARLLDKPCQGSGAEACGLRAAERA